MQADNQSTITYVHILAVAAAYALSGHAGLLLAIEPGFATAIFPAAGIALAALILYGRALWPAVFIGSFTMNLSLGWINAQDIGLLNITVAAGIATGSTLQALFGHWLVSRFVSSPRSLDLEGDIFKFMVLAGPVGCIVSAPVGISTLYSVGFVDTQNVTFSVWTWWIGDTIGVIIAAPLTLLFFGERRKFRKRRLYTVGVPLLISCSVVVVIFIFASEWENQRIQLALSQEAQHVERSLSANIQSQLKVLHSVDRLFASSQFVDRKEFSEFLRGSLEQNSGLRAIEWVARVKHNQRKQFESRVKAEGFENFSIKEIFNGMIITATERDEYFPVTYLEPLAGNESAFGYDLASNPERLTALRQARELGTATATAPIKLVQDNNNQYGFLIFYPVYDQSQSQDTRQQRSNALRGFALGVYLIPQLINFAMQKNADSTFSLSLSDATQDVESILYSTNADAKLVPRYQWKTLIKIADRDFQLVFTPTHEFVQQQKPWQAWLVLAAGLMFASLLGTFLLVISGKSARIERQVDKQTLELKKANEEIQDNNLLLATISEVQSQFISDTSPQDVMDKLLEDLLRITQSEYGFIGEIKTKHDGSLYLKTFAITDISWNEQTRAFYDKHAPDGMEFVNLDTLFGSVIKTGDHMITNNPKEDARSGGLPPGHPALNAFMGLALHKANQLVGMIGIANRPGGYNNGLIQFLQPYLATCSNLIVALTDNKKRIASEIALRNSESHLRAILNNAADAIITFDDCGIIQSVNPAMQQLFGYNEKKLLGNSITCFLPDYYRGMPAEKMLHYFLAGHSRIEIEGQHRQGHRIPLTVSISEIKVNDATLYTGIMHDLTERKKIDRMKDEFVATVSHELRTPLTSILGSLKLLHGNVIKNIPDSAKNLINIALNNSERLLFLVNDILDIEKIQTGNLKLSLKSMQLQQVIQQACHANQGFANKYNSRLELTDNTGHPVWVNVDENRLLQVMNNLLSNAIKFSPPKSKIQIVISLSDNNVQVEVIDQGKGIEEAFKQRVFQKFAQADSSTTREQAGTGLGLSISKELIERMHGEIDFKSEHDKGTTFYFYLPFLEHQSAKVS